MARELYGLVGNSVRLYAGIISGLIKRNQRYAVTASLILTFFESTRCNISDSKNGAEVLDGLQLHTIIVFSIV